nr:putative ferrochelatase [uncultured Mediterranean phage uvMED]
MNEIVNSIENWNNLTLEEKNKAQEDFIEKTIIKEKIFDYDSAKFFKENGYVIITKFINEEMANFMYDYVKLSAKRLLHVHNHNIEHDSNMYGTFGDVQAPGDYSKYGDMVFDTLLAQGLKTINYSTCVDVVPTYSYHRLYTTNTELKKHIDRPSCEISTTLCLGYDISNLKEKDYNWPMYVYSKNEQKEIPIYLNPGDMVIYRGCEIKHWREKFIGKNHAQVFLHYNEKNGQYNNLYDFRPELGLPSSFRTTNDLDMKKENDYLDYGKKIDESKIDYVL